MPILLVAPFGFISDGLDDFNEVSVEKETGDRWMLAKSKNEESNPLEVWNLDEYGDMSSEWNYMWDYR